MSSNQIKIFKAFDLQSCLSKDCLDIQEMINYAENRFRDILMVFGRSGHEKQRLLQKGLYKELVSLPIHVIVAFKYEKPKEFILSYVGTAAAIGQVIDIPVIIRSLARDFYRSAVRLNYSIPLDHDFLVALDAGIMLAEGETVEKFESAWWTHASTIDIDSAMKEPKKLLNINNIDSCLLFHRNQLSLSAAAASISPAAPVPFSPAPAESITPHHSMPVYIWKPDAASPILESDKCKRCRLYRAVSLGSQDERCDIHNLVHGMKVSFSFDKALTMRRASGFNQLYEYLSIKEQDPAVSAAAAAAGQNINNTLPVSAPEIEDDESLPRLVSSKSKKGKKISGRRAVASAVRLGAKAEVERMQNIPSLKWTWGVDMDASDLPALRRSVDTGNQLPHSGYDESLTHGSDTRTDSSVPKYLGEEGFFSEVSDHIRRPVPDLDLAEVPQLNVQRHQRKQSHYLVSFRDSSEGPVEEVRPPAVPLTGLYVPPPPVQCLSNVPSHNNNGKMFIYII
jgi:hypothetical protein